MDFQSAPIVREMEGDACRLVFHGPIHTNTAWIERELDSTVNEKPARVEIDLSDTEHVSSSGMGILIGFRRKIEAAGGKVVVAAIRRRTYRAFCAVRLNETFQIDPA